MYREAAAPAAELRGAELRFGSLAALAGVDLTVAPGERLALIGPSGAGKSSLLALLGGALAPSAGSVRVLGEDPGALSPRRLRALRRRIGTVHQDLRLVEQLRAIHNVNAGRLGEWSLWRALASLLAPRGREEARAALVRLGIAGKLEQRTELLSGGERQRLAVARVIVQRPELVLADEPVASVDPARRDEVLAALEEAGRPGATLIVSLHDVSAALACFPRVVGLRGGRVAFDLPAAEVGAAQVEALYRIERRAEPWPAAVPG